MKPRAVVFAYHNVGVRCLRVLLARGVDVALVVTHEDNPAERIWFGSVAQVAAEHGIETITPADPAGAALREAVARARPDFIFSFYYRLAAAEVSWPRADELGGPERRNRDRRDAA
jgi:methionyl-tRNA formyltransferase